MPSLQIKAGASAQALKTVQPIWFASEQRVNNIPSARLLLSTEGNSVAALSRCEEEIALCQPGNAMTVSIERGGQWELLFKGVVVEQSLSLLKTNAQMELLIKHPLALLDSTYRSQVFSNASAESIINGLLSEQNVSCSNRAQMTTVQEQLIQFRCSDWLYVRRLVDEAAAWLLPDFDQVRIVLPSLAPMPDHTLKSTEVNRQLDSEGQSSVFEANWRFSDRYQPDKLWLTAWDIGKQDLMVARATAEQLGKDALSPAAPSPLNKATWVIGSSTSVSQDKLDGLAQSTLQHLQEVGVQGEFQLRGATRYKLGQTLALSEFGRGFDGAGIITAVSHSIDKALWKTTISLGMKGASAEMTPLSTVKGLQVGVVASFEADPNELNRLRVTLPVLGDDNNTVWARLAMPYASHDGGFYFYPNPGDEVVVGFFDDDPCFPVIVGSMYNPVNPPPVSLSQDNKLKGLAFKDKDMLLQFDTSAKTGVLRAKASVDIKADEINLITK